MIAALAVIAAALIAGLSAIVAAWFQARGAKQAAEASAAHIGQTNGQGTVADMLALVISMQQNFADELGAVKTDVEEIKDERRIVYDAVRSCPFYSDHQFPERF